MEVSTEKSDYFQHLVITQLYQIRSNLKEMHSLFIPLFILLEVKD